MNSPCPQCGNRHGGHELTCPTLNGWIDQATADFHRARDSDGGLTMAGWQAKWGRRVYNAIAAHPEIRERFFSEMLRAVCSSPW